MALKDTFYKGALITGLVSALSGCAQPANKMTYQVVSAPVSKIEGPEFFQPKNYLPSQENPKPSEYKTPEQFLTLEQIPTPNPEKPIANVNGWRTSEPKVKLENIVGVWYETNEQMRYESQNVSADGNLIIFNQDRTYTELRNGISKTEKFKLEETSRGDGIHFYETEKQLEQPNAHISGYINVNGDSLELNLPQYPAIRIYSKTKPLTLSLEHKVEDGRDVFVIDIPERAVKEGRYSPIIENKDICTIPDFESNAEMGDGGKVKLLGKYKFPDDAEKFGVLEFQVQMNEKFPGHAKELETLYAIYSFPREEYDSPENKKDKEATEKIFRGMTFEQIQEYAKKYPWIAPVKDAEDFGLTYEDKIFIGIAESFKALGEIAPLLH